jgi:hypothetical protein
MKAKDLKREAQLNYRQLKHEAQLKAGRLEMYVDGRSECPDGMIEVNVTKGMAIIGRPEGGKTGSVYNRPLKAGEIGRSPEHSHTVQVDDPGHTHVGIVKDCEGIARIPSVNKTGVLLEKLPAKSGVSVSINADATGEHLPLVYVLICQPVAR